MAQSLLINRTAAETRVALLEDSRTVEVHIERAGDQRLAGNLYLGKVVRVLPGMQAAFVDIGVERTGFLYVNDAVLPTETAPEPDAAARRGAPESAATQRRGFQPVADIGQVLRPGQRILVQVQKEPIGSKGARLTRQITLPGRYVVYTPHGGRVGVSARIDSSSERQRLETALEGVRQHPSEGFVVRTAARGSSAAALRREAESLRQMWQDLEARSRELAPPALVQPDLDMALQLLRDLLNQHMQSIWVDALEDYDRVVAFLERFGEGYRERVKYHSGPQPLFHRFGVDTAINRGLQRRVWLDSGAYLVIDETEALTVVDVNSGRYVGQDHLEETITQLNLEAVPEVAAQIRLRNLGGIVVIDFVDMARPESRNKVLSALEEALARDRAKTTVMGMSEIGLVEMTRKRVQESLSGVLTEVCPKCKGLGRVKSVDTIAHEVLRAVLVRLAQQSSDTVMLHLHPSVAEHLYEYKTAEIDRIERLYGTRVIPVAREGASRAQYEVVSGDAQSGPMA